MCKVMKGLFRKVNSLLLGRLPSQNTIRTLVHVCSVFGWIWIFGNTAFTSSSAYGSPEVSCIHSLRALLAPLYEESYRDPEIYHPAYCFYNAGELARRFEKKLNQKIDTSKLQILVFRHRNTDSLSKRATEYQLDEIIVAHNTRAKKFEYWKYHAVLEYNGLVMDLSSAGMEVQPFRTYFQLMFPLIRMVIENKDNKLDSYTHAFNKVGDIVVHAYPASHYLRRFPSRPENMDAIGLDYLLIFPKRSIPALCTQHENRSPLE